MRSTRLRLAFSTRVSLRTSHASMAPAHSSRAFAAYAEADKLPPCERSNLLCLNIVEVFRHLNSHLSHHPLPYTADFLGKAGALAHFQVAGGVNDVF